VSDEDLLEVLHRAREYGYLGPGPIETHIEHARGFGAAFVSRYGSPPRNFCDLGTGGGVPGLVLGVLWPEAQGLLVESMQRRAASLRQAIVDLNLVDRIRVAEGRAEEFAHELELRESFALVTARSFAEPAVTAEIAAGLVEVGGVLIVSEPPEPDSQRWPAEGLAELGFGEPARHVGDSGTFAVIPKSAPAPADRPRGVGKPAKRPLW
jgi:16S rRNA (guanine527-N7)-methyltransferase